jgi:hypothetical protein
MQKLKKQNLNNLNIINYKPFLKNSYLKKNKINIKNILFENNILFKNPDTDMHMIELNNYENISVFLNKNLLKTKLIYTIQRQYENHLLFNYELNSNILAYFNKLICKNFIKKNKKIKGYVLGRNYNCKKVFLNIFGIIFTIKPKNLNIFFKKKIKSFFFNKKRKKLFFYKKIKPTKIIKYYIMKYLNFDIILINNNKFRKKKRIKISRISYIQNLIENKNLIFKKKEKLDYIKKLKKKKKSIFSRKKHAKKLNKKIN